MRLIKYFLYVFTSITLAQTNFTIKGYFPNVIEKEVMLKQYYLNNVSLLSSTKTDKAGYFSVSYPANYQGAALLEIKDTKSVIILLNKENFELRWDNLNDFETLSFTNSYENNTFNKGMELYKNTEFKRSGLSYLIPFYNNEPEKKEFLENELDIQNKSMSLFFDALKQDAFANYYLKIRQLIADMSLTVNRYKDRIAQNEKDFNAINFADKRLMHSGLYFELLEAYVVLIENYGNKNQEHLNKSIDIILNGLSNEHSIKQDVAEYLFNLLEKRSLFNSSEYLAMAMLSNESCKLDAKRESLFEQYRKMAIGKIAPQINLVNTNKPAQEYSLIKSKYKLIVFGASWCPKCDEEIPKLKSYYSAWKKKYELEIIFISLDTKETKYKDFVKDFPWITSCDYKSWEGKTITDYCVFATPTMFLLDDKNKILLKPISPEQITAWLSS